MQVKGIIWVGTATAARAELAGFFEEKLGMDVVTDVNGFTRLVTASGDRVEIFGPEMKEYSQLSTGPVAGFWVEDASTAREELLAGGVDSCTEIETGRDGHSWFYFRAPDGNFYELCEHTPTG